MDYDIYLINELHIIKTKTKPGNMKKLFFALTALILINISANSQDKVKSSKPLHLSFGLNGGAPLGDNSKISSFVIGGDLMVEYGISQNFSVTGSAGIDARLNKGGVVNTIYYAPLLGGIRFYIDDKFYLSEQAGYSLALTKGLNGLFTNVAGVGYKLSQNSDLMIAYKGLFKSGTTLTNFNTFAVRIAYTFGK